MRVLFLGGVFDESHIPEITKKTKTYIEYPANNFQKKILKGLSQLGVQTDVLSAPFLGAYPTAYRDVYFRGFDKTVNDESGYKYVRFNNIWGIRNFSRARSLKKAIREFAGIDDDDKLIIVYTPHTPLIQAANYAKQIDGRIKICLVIPDLPQYMNLSEKISPIYKVMKRIDIKSFQKESLGADSFVLLTEQMADAVGVNGRPYEVIEGIFDPPEVSNSKGDKKGKNIVYTGKLNRSFGVLELAKAFSEINDDSLRLVICGSGEDKDRIIEYAAKDKRIEYLGQVTPNKAAEVVDNAYVLVNPRKNDTEYTKYSFPSKIIDYLATGNPVVAYRLDGMPERYENFIHFVPDNSVESLRDTMIRVIGMPDEEKKKMSSDALRYLNEELSCKNAAKKIIEMNRD